MRNSEFYRTRAKTDSAFLNIAALCLSTQALGPGIRAAVWVQGCPFHCPGCIAPDWIPYKEARLVTPTKLAAELLSEPEVTGLTISGGEPMIQAICLSELVRIARSEKELDVICFTGYRYEQLIKFPKETGVPDFLKEIDVLIDGPYIQALNTGIGLRGSENQNFIYLTDRLGFFDFQSTPRRLEINILENEILMVGIPPKSIDEEILFTPSHISALAGD